MHRDVEVRVALCLLAGRQRLASVLGQAGGTGLPVLLRVCELIGLSEDDLLLAELISKVCLGEAGLTGQQNAKDEEHHCEYGAASSEHEVEISATQLGLLVLRTVCAVAARLRGLRRIGEGGVASSLLSLKCTALLTRSNITDP